jgi:hypothetical protein
MALPERLSHIVGKSRDALSKSQFENFQSVMFGLIVSHCKEHDVKLRSSRCCEVIPVKAH